MIVFISSSVILSLSKETDISCIFFTAFITFAFLTAETVSSNVLSLNDVNFFYCFKHIILSHICQQDL